MFVKPGLRQDDRAQQLVVRGPTGALLPARGGNVPETAFWWRRLRDGDVVEAVPPQIAAEVRRSGPDGQVVEQLAAAERAELVAPLRLTAAEWAYVAAHEATGDDAGPIGTADLQRDPAAPLITHEEFLAEIKA